MGRVSSHLQSAHRRSETSKKNSILVAVFVHGDMLGTHAHAKARHRMLPYIGSILASPTARPYPRNGHAVGDAETPTILHRWERDAVARRSAARYYPMRSSRSRDQSAR